MYSFASGFFHLKCFKDIHIVLCISKLLFISEQYFIL